jgi:hypothetical protein
MANNTHETKRADRVNDEADRLALLLAELAKTWAEHFPSEDRDVAESAQVLAFARALGALAGRYGVPWKTLRVEIEKMRG